MLLLKGLSYDSLTHLSWERNFINKEQYSLKRAAKPQIKVTVPLWERRRKKVGKKTILICSVDSLLQHYLLI